MDLQRAIAGPNILWGNCSGVAGALDRGIGKLSLSRYSYYMGFWLVDRGCDFVQTFHLHRRSIEGGFCHWVHR